MSKNYYETLGVSKEASKEEIKKAYKKLARKYHPDTSQEPDAEQKFKEINEAAGVLLDEEKKKQYDTYGSADGPQGFGGFSGGGFGGGGFDPRDFGINIDDIFEQFGFGGFGGGSSRRERGKDTRVFTEVTLNLDEVYFGVEKDITITRDGACSTCEGKGAKNPSDVKTCDACNGAGVVIETQRSILGLIRTQRTCSTCNGSGKVINDPCSTCNGEGIKSVKETISISIPKGIEDGVTLKVGGKGSFDPITNENGDLYVGINVKRDKTYDVQGSDLYRDIEINFIQAILGDEVEIEHFDKKLSVKIPQGTQSGTILRLKQKGLPEFNYSGYGDLYIKVKVEIPTKVSSKQKELLLEYAKTMKDKSFFKRIKKFFE